MSLRTAIAAPFREAGGREMGESAFVVALSLDRDWFSPDQAKRLVDVAASEGLIRRSDGQVTAQFDPQETTVPEGFRPDESILRERSTFERVLDALTEAGHEKQSAVAAINGLQSELGVTIEAAAVLYAHRQGIDVREQARTARSKLGDDDGS
ncbi:DUF2240 family protein [Natronomonas sp. F2-12]|uniref:DUF2240 family protein n=1 Tax=Natronomonas aquatica TaxID=2841590 RepID=A0A9R1CS13_9EURY|nr:DUF2240 family protein [Natronomonas aquatica]MCQ4332634.1 DUF2240 family protein [Natronomonas aquatica]